MRILDSADEYAAEISKALFKHGPENVKACEYRDPKLMHFVIGVETPDGKFGVTLQTIKRDLEG